MKTFYWWTLLGCMGCSFITHDPLSAAGASMVFLGGVYAIRAAIKEGMS